LDEYENTETNMYMKALLMLNIVAAGILVAGCVSDNENKVALDTVGPAPVQTPAISPSTNGTLAVYSAFRRTSDFDIRDPYRPEYSDYRIYNADGEFLRNIHNDSGTFLQDPASVSLAPGRYRVVARANGFGFITVPILIEAGQSTVLHLEGGDPGGDAPGFSQTNAVRLPDGQIVGWRSPAGS
jgi:hypothetical protein